MKNILYVISIVMLCGLFIVGCEESEGNEGLIIDPNYVDMVNDSSARWFTVTGKNDAANITSDSTTSSSGTNTTTTTSTVTDNMALNDLSYPLTWSVSDASLGTIVESSGDTALYRKTSNSGHQIITVRDQYGNEGYASVYQ